MIYGYKEKFYIVTEKNMMHISFYNKKRTKNLFLRIHTGLNRKGYTKQINYKREYKEYKNKILWDGHSLYFYSFYITIGYHNIYLDLEEEKEKRNNGLY